MHNDDENDESNKFSTVASYTILEGFYGKTELDSISFNSVRVPYDIKQEVEDLEKSDMPNKEVIIKTLTSAISNN